VTPHPDHPSPLSGRGDDAARDEAELVALAQGGDAAAFDRLFAPHLSRAFLVARRIVGSRVDAEDLVQNACLRAIEQLGRLTPGNPFGPWFLRLLINVGLNHHKAERIRATESFDEEHHSSTNDPHRNAEQSEFRLRFAQAVERLPPRQRVIVMMFDVDGQSGADIASALGISADTVRWHLHAARAALRSSLSEFGPTTKKEGDGI